VWLQAARRHGYQPDQGHVDYEAANHHQPKQGQGTDWIVTHSVMRYSATGLLRVAGDPIAVSIKVVTSCPTTRTGPRTYSGPSPLPPSQSTSLAIGTQVTS
jgi:hypothetical protein